MCSHYEIDKILYTLYIPSWFKYELLFLINFSGESTILVSYVMLVLLLAYILANRELIFACMVWKVQGNSNKGSDLGRSIYIYI